MALRFKINKAQYDALSEELKKEYIVGDKDGEYVVDLLEAPQPEDTGPLKRTIEALRGEKTTLTNKVTELQTKIDGMPNVEELTKTHKAETKKLTDFVNNSLVDAQALALATAISTAPTLLAPAIAKRLKADLSGDEPKTVILGADGKPNAEATFDTLKQEFVANKEFAAIIKASNARGSGAPLGGQPKQPGSGAPAGGDQGGDFNAATAKPSDLAARIKERKAAEQNQQQA